MTPTPRTALHWIVALVLLLGAVSAARMDQPLKSLSYAALSVLFALLALGADRKGRWARGSMYGLALLALAALAVRLASP